MCYETICNVTPQCFSLRVVVLCDWGVTVIMAEVKERTKEEILQEKTYRERCFVDYRIEEMQKEYEEARSYGRWDKKRECYVNHKGDPVVHSSQVVYNDVLAIIPLSGEYYSKIEQDKDYLKKLDKITRGVMTASLKKKKMKRGYKKVLRRWWMS
ncbi:hypothetical protein Hanom_Chr04g00333891 [Helianthus anomalus]